VPECKTPAGCLIPPLSERGSRLLLLRGMRLALGSTIDPGTICRAFEREHGKLEWFDLELLAAVEAELKPEESADGERR
jgi:hypothetical protein